MTNREKRIQEFEKRTRDTYQILRKANFETRSDEEIENIIQDQITAEHVRIDWEENYIKSQNLIFGTNYEWEGGFTMMDWDEEKSETKKLQNLVEQLKDQVYQINCFQKTKKKHDKEWYDKMLKAMLKVVNYYKIEIEKLTK